MQLLPELELLESQGNSVAQAELVANLLLELMAVRVCMEVEAEAELPEYQQRMLWLLVGRVEVQELTS